jgi:hypothetical protein
MSPVDRFGDPVEEPPEVSDEWPDVDPPHDPRCRKGWLDADADNPVPCLVCKPHLAPGRRVRIGQQ